MVKKLTTMVALLAVVIAGCASGISATPTLTQPSAPDSTPTADTLSASNSDAATWMSLPLTDARTGETFRLSDYAGKTVWVEPMATWCTNCRHQLPNVEAARKTLNPDQYAFVSLSVAENVDNATLAQYADEQGWGWTFAVATENITQGLVNTFGRTVVTPPSTPHFIIKRDGSFTDISTGTPSTDEIMAELKTASGG